eukprot:5160-Chlamydomonas_euryale.AAC.1
MTPALLSSRPVAVSCRQMIAAAEAECRRAKNAARALLSATAVATTRLRWKYMSEPVAGRACNGGGVIVWSVGRGVRARGRLKFPRTDGGGWSESVGCQQGGRGNFWSALQSSGARQRDLERIVISGAHCDFWSTL